MSAISISRSGFAHVFRSFQEAVAAHPDSRGPFVDFQSGLAADWERYKVWLYWEAKRLLAPETWKESWIGTRRILDHVIASIEIKRDNEYRNNIVEWEIKRRGEDKVSHARLLAARKSPYLINQLESLLYRFYVEEADAEAAFSEMTEQLGGRYDLISYLFFLRDWNTFMPLRSTIYPVAFEKLGVPHPMRAQCNWGNYQGFLERLSEVRRHLESYDIPKGVRLVDAHSFCWMLAKLPPTKAQKKPITAIHQLLAEAGSNRNQLGTKVSGFSQEELDALVTEQRRIGSIAQQCVLDAEKERLKQAGRADLAAQVDNASLDVSLGYDIESFFSDGKSKPIEVKAAAQRGADLRFFISENELRRSQSLDGYTFALVTEVSSARPSIFEFLGNSLPEAALHPVNYEVRLKRQMKSEPSLNL